MQDIFGFQSQDIDKVNICCSGLNSLQLKVMYQIRSRVIGSWPNQETNSGGQIISTLEPKEKRDLFFFLVMT